MLKIILSNRCDMVPSPANHEATKHIVTWYKRKGILRTQCNQKGMSKKTEGHRFAEVSSLC